MPTSATPKFRRGHGASRLRSTFARTRAAAGAVFILDRLYLLVPLTRAIERMRALLDRNNVEADEQGPVPSAELRVLVTGKANADSFLRSGRRAAKSIQKILGRNSIKFDSLETVLDFGCGCGRVARHLASHGGPEFYGSDYNPKLASWCDENLRPFTGIVNGLEPPLPLEAGKLDLIYALSVLTHLDERVQDLWMAEFARVLRPGGWLVVSTHGRVYADRLRGSEREAFGRGEMVVRAQNAVGTNACISFHPPRYLASHFAPDFEVVDHWEGAAKGNGRQDLALLRRTSHQAPETKRISAGSREGVVCSAASPEAEPKASSI